MGKLLVVPNVTRWNSVYDGVTCLLLICDSNKAGLLSNKACRKLEMRFFTACSSFALLKLDITKLTNCLGELDFLQEYKVVMTPIAAALDILQGEEKAYMGLLMPMLASL